MNTIDLIEKTADINTDLLEEAAALKRTPYKRLKISAVLCCLIASLGVTAYATGMLNNVFIHREYNSNEHEYIDGIEVQGYAIETELPIVDPAEIKGDVRSIKTEEGSGGVHGLKKEDLSGYIGYEPFDELWFPYDKYETLVSVETERPEYGIKTIRVSVCNFTVSRAEHDVISPENADSDFLVRSTATIRVRTKTDTTERELFGIRYTESDEHTIITSKSGCECHIITSDYAGHFTIMGVTVRNGIWYEFIVNFRNESDRAEADRIVRAWAEHF